MKVSIVTVCFNAGAYLAQTIASVLAQDYPDFEYIIVDGGSSDNTLDIIGSHRGDARLRWLSEPDKGVADAMNKGVALARGDLVAHLNADDCYATSQVIARVVDCFRQNPDILWLTGGFDFVDANGVFLRSIRVRRYSFRRLVRGNIILHPSTFIRYDAYCKVGGFDTTLRYCMDYDLFLRLGELAPPFLLDQQLSCFRVHAASRTVSESERSYAEEFFVRKRFLQQRGRSILPYWVDYQVKKYFNHLFYRRLSSAGHGDCR